MQCRSVLVRYSYRLSAAIAIRTVAMQCVDAMLAEAAFECGAASHRFGCLSLHPEPKDIDR